RAIGDLQGELGQDDGGDEREQGSADPLHRRACSRSPCGIQGLSRKDGGSRRRSWPLLTLRHPGGALNTMTELPPSSLSADVENRARSGPGRSARRPSPRNHEAGRLVSNMLTFPGSVLSTRGPRTRAACLDDERPVMTVDEPHDFRTLLVGLAER